MDKLHIASRKGASVCARCLVLLITVDVVISLKCGGTGTFRDNTFHDTTSFGRVVRTKYFFNARYLWTKEDNETPGAKRAEGLQSQLNNTTALCDELEDDCTVCVMVFLQESDWMSRGAETGCTQICRNRSRRQVCCSATS